MSNFLDRLFPLRNIKNVAMFYVMTAVINAWIIAGVWVFIWGAFMTNTEMGISDSITFTIGFLVELPSGVFADIIGRKKAIVIGNALLVVGNLFVALSSSFLGITWWYLIWTIGYAFQSGSTEAHTYDTLKRLKLEDKWHDVISSSTVIAKTSTLLSTAVGGYLFAAGFRLPYLTTAAIGVIGLIAAINLDHIPVKKIPNPWSPENYLSQIKEGLGILVKRHILPISLISLVVMGIAYMYNWGLLRPLTADRFGYTPTTYSLLISLTSLIGIFFISIFNKVQKLFKLENLIFVFGFIYSLMFFVMGYQHGLIVGGAITITLSVCLTYIDILFSKYINKHTSESHRATTLSAVALFTKMPYIFLALLIGKIADNNGLPQYTIIVGMVALVIFAISLFGYITTSKLNTSKS